MVLERQLLYAVGEHRAGRLRSAEAAYRRLLAAAPHSVEAHNNLGKLLRDTGRPAEAAASFRAALRLQPNVPEVHHNLGLALLDQDDRPGAEAAFRNALRLNRDFVAARIDLATLLIKTQRPADAEACVRAALRCAPMDPRGHNVLGLALGVQLKHAEALTHFDAAIAQAPGFYLEAHTNRAASLVSLKRLEEAEAAYRGILAIVPDDRVSLVAIGQVLVALGRANDTEPFLRALIKISPDDADLYFALGGVLSRTDRKEEAVTQLQAALRLQPDHANALHGLGIALYDLGRFDESLPLVERAAALAPDDPEIQSSLSYAYLLRGDYARGWPLFEWRVRKAGNARLAEPVWDGSPTDGVVLVHAEQGVGDTLQFCRFLPLAAQRARIVVAAPASCGRLFECFTSLHGLYTEPPLPPCDFQLPMMSLARVLGVAEADFAAAVPYLHADRALTQHWRARLAAFPGLRVGLVWAGNPQYPADRHRSLPLAALRALRDIPNISFVSLQKGEAASQIDTAGWETLSDVSADLHDFADTAALLMALDLLICVDTAVAHLAGALQRPVWMLNRADTDWRWQLGREDSPWYPTMRIFRQRTAGDWSDALAHLRDCLRGFAE